MYEKSASGRKTVSGFSDQWSKMFDSAGDPGPNLAFDSSLLLAAEPKKPSSALDDEFSNFMSASADQGSILQNIFGLCNLHPLNWNKFPSKSRRYKNISGIMGKIILDFKVFQSHIRS
jgi:hypothetical protein